MPTKLWGVRAGLVATFTTATSSLQLSVVDGPKVKDTKKEFLLVGSDGGEDGLGDAGDDGAVASQEPSPMANGWRQETGEIVCSAWSWSGGDDLAPLRARAQAIVDACEQSLYTDPTVAGALIRTSGDLAEIVGHRVRELHFPGEGSQVRITFIVAYRALITS